MLFLRSNDQRVSGIWFVYVNIDYKFVIVLNNTRDNNIGYTFNIILYTELRVIHTYSRCILFRKTTTIGLAKEFKSF